MPFVEGFGVSLLKLVTRLRRAVTSLIKPAFATIFLVIAIAGSSQVRGPQPMAPRSPGYPGPAPVQTNAPRFGPRQMPQMYRGPIRTNLVRPRVQMPAPAMTNLLLSQPFTNSLAQSETAAEQAARVKKVVDKVFLGISSYLEVKDELKKLGEPAFEALIPHLFSYNPWERIDAIYALSELGNPRAIRFLVHHLNTVNVVDREWSHLMAALDSLLKLQPSNEMLMDILTLKTGDTKIVRFKMIALRQLSERGDASCIKMLRFVVANDFKFPPEVKVEAASALAAIQSRVSPEEWDSVKVMKTRDKIREGVQNVLAMDAIWMLKYVGYFLKYTFVAYLVVTLAGIACSFIRPAGQQRLTYPSAVKNFISIHTGEKIDFEKTSYAVLVTAELVMVGMLCYFDFIYTLYGAAKLYGAMLAATLIVGKVFLNIVADGAHMSNRFIRFPMNYFRLLSDYYYTGSLNPRQFLLFTRLDHWDPRVCIGALEESLALGEEGIPVLKLALDNRLDAVRFTAVHDLRELKALTDEDLVKKYLADLKLGTNEIKAQAVIELGLMGPRAQSAGPALIGILASEQETWDQAEVVRSIARIDADVTDATFNLIVKSDPPVWVMVRLYRHNPSLFVNKALSRLFGVLSEQLDQKAEPDRQKLLEEQLPQNISAYLSAAGISSGVHYRFSPGVAPGSAELQEPDDLGFLQYLEMIDSLDQGKDQYLPRARDWFKELFIPPVRYDRDQCIADLESKSDFTRYSAAMALYDHNDLSNDLMARKCRTDLLYGSKETKDVALDDLQKIGDSAQIAIPVLAEIIVKGKRTCNLIEAARVLAGLHADIDEQTYNAIIQLNPPVGIVASLHRDNPSLIPNRTLAALFDAVNESISHYDEAVWQDMAQSLEQPLKEFLNSLTVARHPVTDPGRNVQPAGTGSEAAVAPVKMKTDRYGFLEFLRARAEEDTGSLDQPVPIPRIDWFKEMLIVPEKYDERRYTRDLEAQDDLVRYCAARSLHNHKKLTVPMLVRKYIADISYGSRDVGLEAVIELGKLGPAATAAGPILAGKLRNEDEFLRITDVIETLALIAADIDEPAFSKLLKHNPPVWVVALVHRNNQGLIKNKALSLLFSTLAEEIGSWSQDPLVQEKMRVQYAQDLGNFLDSLSTYQRDEREGEGRDNYGLLE